LAIDNQTWQQPVGFVAVPDAALASLAILTHPGVSPFALPDAKKAPPAPQQSYASVAKSTKTIFSVFFGCRASKPARQKGYPMARF